MKIRIERLSPHQNAKVVGVLMALGSLLLAIPMFLIFLLIPMPADVYGTPAPPAFMFLLFPFLYLAMGYIVTAVLCLLYNFVCRYIGGIEYEARTDGT